MREPGMDGPSCRANPLVLLRPHLSRPLGVSVRNPLLARDGNPAEAEAKEQFVGSRGTWRTGEGAAHFQNTGGRAHGCPRLSRSWPPLSFLLFGLGWCHFLPPQMGLFVGQGAWLWATVVIEIQFCGPRGEEIAPCAPQNKPRKC